MLQIKTHFDFVHLGTSLSLLPYTLSEETTQRKHTHTYMTTFPRPNNNKYFSRSKTTNIPIAKYLALIILLSINYSFTNSEEVTNIAI